MRRCEEAHRHKTQTHRYILDSVFEVCRKEVRAKRVKLLVRGANGGFACARLLRDCCRAKKRRRTNWCSSQPKLLPPIIRSSSFHPFLLFYLLISAPPRLKCTTPHFLLSSSCVLVAVTHRTARGLSPSRALAPPGTAQQPLSSQACAPQECLPRGRRGLRHLRYAKSACCLSTRAHPAITHMHTGTQTQTHTDTDTHRHTLSSLCLCQTD